MAKLSVIEFGEEQHRLCEEKGDFAEGRFWLAYLNGAMAQQSEYERLGAVPVVRCKDCRHRSDETSKGCYFCNHKMLGMIRSDDFCSCGERKDGAK